MDNDPRPPVPIKNPGRLARHLAQAEAIIANPATDERRRALLAEKAEHMRSQLAGGHRCQRCGKALTDPTSVKRGVGSECWAKQGRAA